MRQRREELDSSISRMPFPIVPRGDRSLDRGRYHADFVASLREARKAHYAALAQGHKERFCRNLCQLMTLQASRAAGLYELEAGSEYRGGMPAYEDAKALVEQAVKDGGASRAAARADGADGRAAQPRIEGGLSARAPESAPELGRRE